MIRYGDKVVIRDGSLLDGAVGIVYKIRDGEVQILIDREVFWLVAEDQLEHDDHRCGETAPGRQK